MITANLADAANGLAEITGNLATIVDRLHQVVFLLDPATWARMMVLLALAMLLAGWRGPSSGPTGQPALRQ
jgi:hypothetical protein